MYTAGALPVPERWNEDSGKAAFNLEETDPSDQVCPTTTTTTVQHNPAHDELGACRTVLVCPHALLHE